MNELTEFTGTKASRIAQEIEETEAEAIEALAELEEIRKDERMRDRDAEKAYALAQYGAYSADPEEEKIRKIRSRALALMGMSREFSQWKNPSGDEWDRALDTAIKVIKTFTSEQSAHFDVRIKEMEGDYS